MTKILITRRLLKPNEEHASKIFKTILNKEDKTFTKDDLMNKYKYKNNDIFLDKVVLQNKKDIENYIKSQKNKSNIQTL